jgi:P pilus assembly chaperone PapD
MFKSKQFKRMLAFLVAPLAILAATTTALATAVEPVVIDLQASGRRMSQVVTVRNTFGSPLPVELRVQEAEYSADGVRGTGRESDDLLVFPPQAIIQPGRTQSFRVQYVGDPALSQSKHYFVTVAQLPVQLPEGQSAVQVLYNFQVVVGVGVTGARPALRVVRAEIVKEGDGQPRAALFVENRSNTYGYLSGGALRIVQKDAGGREVFRRVLTGEEVAQQIGYGLVGGGQTRRILVPFPLPQAGGSIEAQITQSRS